MTTFAVTDPEHTVAAVNYLLSNLGAQSGNANVVIPGNVITANTTTGIITNYGNTSGTPYWFQYQYINLRYANSADGSVDFSIYPANTNYFGIYNSTTTVPSTNPAAYNWNQVAGGFGTTKTIYYSAIGGRQIQWAAANAAPSSDFVVSVANVAINLDVVTTAAGTPGERGPIAMAYVVTPSDPNAASSATLTTWFSAPRDAVTAPIGTGLIPVTGDTANFSYSAGVGSPNATYTYNGSIWVPAFGQVIDGNLIVRGSIAGNAMIANTITGNLIAASTITATNIAANTITGNKIAANTITGSSLVIGTITGNLIANNAVTSTQIANGTITTNQIAANTITGNNIAAGTITANNLAANTLTANTVVSTGATIGSLTSPGFWLQGSTGNARFGNNLSVGNSLTVGANAVIGNNASIGGNLNVTGLITTGALVANSVATTTIVVNGVSSGLGNSATNTVTVGSPSQFSYYYMPTTSSFTTTQANQAVYVWAQVVAHWVYGGVASPTTVLDIGTELIRTNVSTGVVTIIFQQDLIDSIVWSQQQPSAFDSNAIWAGFLDTVPTPGTYTYTIREKWINQGGTFTISSLVWDDRSILTQSLKR